MVVVNVADLVRDVARKTPDRVALVAGENRLSWSELDQRIDRAAAGLAGAGLVPGYRVGLALPNTIDFVVGYFGALRGGYVAVPVNPLAPAPEIEHVVRATRLRLMVADESSIAAVRQGCAGSDAVVVATGVAAEPGELTFDELLRSAPDVSIAPLADEEALAVLLFTSGTSSAPRAAMLTHRALVANLDQVAAIDPPAIGPDDVVLGLVPFFHVFGLNGVLGASVRSGARLVLAGRFDAEQTLDLVAEQGVTNIPVAPPVFVAWAGRPDLAERLKGVRLMVSGAAPLPVSAAEEIEAATGIVVHEGYGLTEACPAVSSTLCSETRKLGSVGSALPGVEVRIGSGDLLPDDPGEIFVRGANLFSGYWPKAEGGPDADGWFATGDLGYLDSDGDLFLVDRSKELVLVSGFNVYPHEVEAVILGLDGVLEAAVVGVPDAETGEAVRAYVVTEPDADVTSEDVREYCELRLARFKCPSVVELVAELPKSATGKIAKVRLREPSDG
ncbi:acyl-CoA synthetase family protein [Flindersiella endophytica]